MLVIAHRGGALLEPENTLRAFRRALELGCDAVEADVRVTRDGHLVLMHDSRVDRTTDGTGWVAELSLAEILALDAGRGERVPTLEEALGFVAGRVPFVCELKVPEAVAPAVDLVRASRLGADVLFASFDLEHLARVKAIDRSLRTLAIFDRPPPDFVEQAQDVGAEGVTIHYRRLSPEIVEAARRQGLAVHAWTVNLPDDIRDMIALGIDAIATDRPDLALAMLGRARPPTPPPPPAPILSL